MGQNWRNVNVPAVDVVKKYLAKMKSASPPSFIQISSVVAIRGPNAAPTEAFNKPHIGFSRVEAFLRPHLLKRILITVQFSAFILWLGSYQITGHMRDTEVLISTVWPSIPIPLCIQTTQETRWPASDLVGTEIGLWPAGLFALTELQGWLLCLTVQINRVWLTALLFAFLQ